MSKLINVIIVDDHRLFRMGLRAAFISESPDINVVGEADSGEELFRVLATTPAEIILLDINLNGSYTGAEITCRLRREYPDIKILAISAENTAETIKEMMEAGINGFISKQNGDTFELAEAIRSVTDGLEYFGRDIASIIFDVFVTKKKSSVVTDEFTTREKEIINLCKDGLLCKEIAHRLGISINTVNTYKKSIFQKLGINNTMEMVQFALKRGIIRV